MSQVVKFEDCIIGYLVLEYVKSEDIYKYLIIYIFIIIYGLYYFEVS